MRRWRFSSAGSGRLRGIDANGLRSPATRPAGPTGRVAAVHRQARPTVLLAAAFAVAALVAAAAPAGTGRWLPLHLFLVGSVLLAISAVTQVLTVTWGAAPAPDDRLVAVQRWLVAAGAAGVVAGREAGSAGATSVAAAAVLAGLALLAVLLVATQRRAVQARFAPAVRAYLVAVVAGGVGVALGAGMVVEPARMGDLRTAHVVVNLLGLVGLVIAGTLPWFVATQAKVRMSPRATAGSQSAVAAALAAGVAVAAAGAAAGAEGAVTAGLAVYVAALVAGAALLPRLGAKQLRWAGPRLLQLGAGLAWWAGAVSLAAWRSATGAVAFDGKVVAALVVGGYAQVLLASLAYVGPVLVGGGHARLARAFDVTRSWPGLVLGNVAAVSLAAGGPAWATAAALAAWGADAAVRAARLVALRRRP